MSHSFIDTKDIEGLPINPKRKGIGERIDLMLKTSNNG